MALRHLRIPLAHPIALMIACSLPSASTGHGQVVRDSAGITIVENTVDAGIAEWVVSETPVLSIGVTDGDEAYQFFGVAGVHRDAAGRLIVLNAGSRQVRVFSAKGEFLRSFGQRGRGPEEFEMPVVAGVSGDTLVIVDRANHRLSYVHPDLGFVRSVRVSDDVGGYLNPAGMFGNGQAVFGGAFDMRRIGELRNGFNRAGTFFRSCRPDGALATDFGDVPGAEFFIEDINASGPASRPVLIPFGKIAQATVSADFFFFSDQDDWEIEVSSAAGELVRLIRLDREPAAVTRADRDRFVEQQLQQARDDAHAAEIRRRAATLPTPEYLPAHGRLLADRLGHLWVEEYTTLERGKTAWLIFDQAGRLRARVTLPGLFQPLEIGTDYVLGVGRDDLDVEHVRTYRLERRAG